jgi:hypothetical protein
MTAKVSVAGTIVHVDNRYLAVWVRERGAWKFVAYHNADHQGLMRRKREDQPRPRLRRSSPWRPYTRARLSENASSPSTRTTNCRSKQSLVLV